MPVSLGTAYRDAAHRIDARVRTLAVVAPAELDTRVPACPDWTVRDVVAHLAGIAVDAVGGRLAGVPDDVVTAGQVAKRAGRPVEEVLDEWAQWTEAVAAALDARTFGPPPCADVLTHEGDLAEALGDPVPPDGWQDVARLLCRGTITRIDRPGTLTVSVADDGRGGTPGEVWTGGAGGEGPDAAVTVERWELFRGVFSRRSRRQMLAWSWTGDPEPWLGPLCVFGVREDDQPVARPR